jgi:hypothetical protein
LRKAGVGGAEVAGVDCPDELISLKISASADSEDEDEFV